MAKLKQITFFIVVLLLFVGCSDDRWAQYEKPTWLEGKVYSQMKKEPELSTFIQCLERTGLDTIIDVSGSYTVFAPTNDAFTAYFQGNPNYHSVQDIPVAELSKLVKYHIVQNPWSKIQLRTLDVAGWIDTMALVNNEPKGFKRETILKNSDIKVGATYDDKVKRYVITDTLTSNVKRRIITDYRKYVPFFYSEYFDIYDLNSSDYNFYFGRQFNSSDLYIANAKITGDEIFAENGFIYKIDQVIEPMKNGYEFLSESTNGTQPYSDFLKLINHFPQFTFNLEKTNDQLGAAQGLVVDSLFDISFPQLTFNIYNEKTRPPSGTFGLPSNVSIRYHHGLLAPTNEALNSFLAEYINGPQYWGTIDKAPEHIKRIIVNTYMSSNPVYESDLQKGFYNGELDIVKVDEADIREKEFGSNCTFIGLNKAIVPRAFSSVTGPIYQQPGFSTAMYAIERSGLLPALKKEGQYLSLFMEDDESLAKDSSLLYTATVTGNYVTQRFTAYQISPSGEVSQFNIGISDLRTLILNHIAVQKPNGIARKEFIMNMAGNHLIVNNVTGEVKGTVETTNGYGGSQIVQVIPKKISVNADNGDTYQVGDWFNFAATNLYSTISGSYPRFHQLLIEAGLVNEREYRYNFMSESDYYTVLVPSNAALDNFDKTSVTTAELKNILLTHFIQGSLIFTDGNLPSGYYETTRVDEKSTPYSVVYTKMKVNTGYDVITIPKKDGSSYLTINESETSNIITARNLGAGITPTPVYPIVATNGVIHVVDRVLRVQDLDTK